MHSGVTHKKAPAIQSLDKHGKNEADISLDQLLRKATKLRASSIHIEPTPTSSVIRFRIDGAMRPGTLLSKHLHRPLVRAVKDLANIDSEETHKPQSGSTTAHFAKLPYNLEVMTLSALEGEKVVIHIAPSEGLSSLESMGYYGKTLSEFGRLLSKPRGLIVIAGSYNSDTHKTLHAALQLLDHPALTIAKVHTNNSKITDSMKLRLAMQHNPDVISISDISDKELLDTALEAAHHHLVIATLSAADTATTYTRLLHWAEDKHVLASRLLGVVFQSMQPRLCDACKKPHTLNAAEQTAVTAHDAILSPLITKYVHESGVTKPGAHTQNHAGCKDCELHGIYGQIAGIQLNLTSSAVQKLLLAENFSLKLSEEQLSRDAVVSLKTDQLVKSLAGLTVWQRSLT